MSVQPVMKIVALRLKLLISIMSLSSRGQTALTEIKITGFQMEIKQLFSCRKNRPACFFKSKPIL